MGNGVLIGMAVGRDEIRVLLWVAIKKNGMLLWVAMVG